MTPLTILEWPAHPDAAPAEAKRGWGEGHHIFADPRVGYRMPGWVSTKFDRCNTATTTCRGRRPFQFMVLVKVLSEIAMFL